MKMFSADSLQNLDSFFSRIGVLNTRSTLAVSMFQMDCCEPEVVTQLLTDLLSEYRNEVLNLAVYLDSLGISK